jgi:3-deoxy-D-manno-octulosonate cytidylyltransferase
MSGPVLVVVPARFGSERLPGKPLADLGGRPMVVRVAEAVGRARRVDGVVVATDDPRVLEAARAHGVDAVLTRVDHPTGTDRVAEVAAGRPAGLVVNVQGDEPLVDPDHVDALVDAFSAPEVDVATLCAPLSGDPQDPHRVKLVRDQAGRALYFSRAAIPTGGPWLLHIGVYAFRPAALRAFAALGPGRLERAERLEQLRFLEHGLTIQVVEVAAAHPSVDTPADLQRVRQHFPSGA